MNITIITGGTGSISLQEALYSTISNLDGINVKILVNAYDNGKSTGAVRRVFHNKILGPSDVRKNHSTILRYSSFSELIDIQRKQLLDILDHRFTVDSKISKSYCLSILDNNLTAIDDSKINIMKNGIYTFFASASSSLLNYEDFSLANIIYGGLAALNDNSLRKAATIMADILEIPDMVILNSDESLMLKAVRKSGAIIETEEDIDIAGSDDPIDHIFFTDHNDKIVNPSVLCSEAIKTLEDSDIIILSSGTLSTTLLPTYITSGFKEVLEKTNAKIYMITNMVPDDDYPNMSGDEMLNTILTHYLPTNKITAFCHSINEKLSHCAISESNKNIKNVVYDDFSFSFSINPIHNGERILKSILNEYYGETINSNILAFDYDDTINGRNGSYPKSTNFNKMIISQISNLKSVKAVAVCTGSFKKMVNLSSNCNFDLYSSGGNMMTLHNNDNGRNKKIQHPVRYVNEKFIFSNEQRHNIIQKLIDIGIDKNLIISDECKISITPIDDAYRNVIKYAISSILNNDNLTVSISGRTTVEITFKLADKMLAINDLFNRHGKSSTITYVGDEFDGNDKSIYKESLINKNIRFVKIHNPGGLALFLITSKYYKNGQ